MILYPGKGMTRRSRLAFGLVQVVKFIADLRMRVTSVEYDETQDSTVEGIPRP